MTFFCKLLPPRAGFLQDMTPAEGQLMQEHAAYWKEWMGRGHVVAFGVVGDPAGVFGMGVVEFDGEADARAFTDGVDAAAVYVNASTRFTDGAVFGMGAEIGNSTQKLHARGPIGLRELTTYKYVIEGSGQVRE